VISQVLSTVLGRLQASAVVMLSPPPVVWGRETDFACREITARAVSGTVSVRSPRYPRRSLHQTLAAGTSLQQRMVRTHCASRWILEPRSCPAAGSARTPAAPPAPARGGEAAAAALQLVAARWHPQGCTSASPGLCAGILKGCTLASPGLHAGILKGCTSASLAVAWQGPEAETS